MGKGKGKSEKMRLLRAGGKPVAFLTCLSIWDKTKPVGPAPNIRTEEPSLGEILSRPCAAHEAGSRRVASTSERLWSLNTLPAG
jgi:hypothetical protein